MKRVRIIRHLPLNEKFSKFEVMKTMSEINEKKVPAVRIDSSLDKYDDIVLFPEKLEKANEKLTKSGFPKLPKKQSR
jgi:hypothetical protein